MRRPPRRATRAHLAAARRLPGYGHSRLGVPVLPAKFVSVRARRSESCARLPRAEPREGPQAPFEAPCLLGPLLARPPAAATPPRGSRAVRSCSSSCPALPPWRPGSLGARSGPRHRVDGDQDSVLCSAAVERAFALERLPQAASVRPGCPASPLLRPEDGTIRALPRWILGMRGAAVCILIFPVRIERFGRRGSSHPDPGPLTRTPAWQGEGKVAACPRSPQLLPEGRKGGSFLDLPDHHVLGNLESRRGSTYTTWGPKGNAVDAYTGATGSQRLDTHATTSLKPPMGAGVSCSFQRARLLVPHHDRSCSHATPSTQDTGLQACQDDGQSLCQRTRLSFPSLQHPVTLRFQDHESQPLPGACVVQGGLAPSAQRGLS
ncbi:uncharacterized protein LOC122232923 isoform X1 [Panthera tigris]|uniref:uncharacterized protein LOC122232923 isoform X1 n=1 Tax=Panthera tigris TaxID=9694 RepID=UPI001C6FABE0|nr:uncharacterized protein LOC122232923 isoform X1 [Panthera tigris]XP_042819244.1 uncharacterized protein LOC122232923 isoform X1 [Panthera tigris]XP_042819245.1 uncharacterized protein LOC122232923 isoform X1 [Panthera tigris]